MAAVDGHPLLLMPRETRTGMIGREAHKAAWEFAKTLVVAFLLAHFIMVSVAQAFQVEQYSMEPNLLPHGRV